MKRTKQGFTLIELVVVMVILAILTVVAMPKFINLKDSANTSALQGVSAAVHDAVELAHSKAVVLNKQNEAYYAIDGAGSIQFGYPAVNKQGLVEFLTLDEGYHDLSKEWVWAARNNGSVTTLIIGSQRVRAICMDTRAVILMVRLRQRSAMSNTQRQCRSVMSMPLKQ